MSLKINDNKVLKRCSQIWKKVKNLLNIKFNSEPVYGDNDIYVKTKTKIYDGNVNKNKFSWWESTKKMHHISVCH